jgi:hypothetical protein
MVTVLKLSVKKWPSEELLVAQEGVVLWRVLNNFFGTT